MFGRSLSPIFYVFSLNYGEFLPWLKVTRVGHVEAPFCLAVPSFSQCFSLTIAYNLQFIIEMDLLQNCLSRHHVNCTSACAVSTEIGDCSTQKSCELAGNRRRITTITTIWKLKCCNSIADYRRWNYNNYNYMETRLYSPSDTSEVIAFVQNGRIKIQLLSFFRLVFLFFHLQHVSISLQVNGFVQHGRIKTLACALLLLLFCFTSVLQFPRVPYHIPLLPVCLSTIKIANDFPWLHLVNYFVMDIRS